MGFRPPSGVGGVSGTASVRLRGGSGTWGAEPSARLRTGVATGVGVSTLAVLQPSQAQPKNTPFASAHHPSSFTRPHPNHKIYRNVT